MSRLLHGSLVTPEAYLEGEKTARVRHEYVAGQVYAMVGGSKPHNRIASAFLSALRRRLAGGPCDVYIADVKVRTAKAFYYPDVVVDCQPSDAEPYFTDSPVLVVEVVSPSTRSIDEREKRVAYQGLASLQEYVLAEQDRPEVRVFRRQGDRWTVTRYGPGEVVRLESVDADLSMESIYDGAWRGTP